ncbi:MAG: metallophosphoesterase [Thermoleophilia bacterium]
MIAIPDNAGAGGLNVTGPGGGAGAPLSRRAFLGGLLGVGLAASYPFAVERYLVSVNHYEIPIRGLSPTFDGFRILHLTDLHYGSLVPLAWLRTVLERALREEADLIVLTGDYVQSRDTRHELDVIWPELLSLKAPHGVRMVLGNHDHWADADHALTLLHESGLSLRHRAETITVGDGRLLLAGAGDHWEDKALVDETLAGWDPELPRIVLAHNPDTADGDFHERVDVFICGHTHGGQVRVPFLGSPVLPVANKRYDQGVKQAGDTTVFISRGIGWAVLPVRFDCPPEIAVLHLRCA